MYSLVHTCSAALYAQCRHQAKAGHLSPMCVSMSLAYTCISVCLGSQQATQPDLNLIGSMSMLYVFGYFLCLSVSVI